MDILKGLRPLDIVLTGVMAALAAFIALENVNAGADADLAHTLDSQSALMVPVFVLAALPLLWRRRHVLGAIGVSLAVMAASVPMFGWVTRCGFALPLTFALAYAVARFAGTRERHLLGWAGLLALQVVVLVRDASTGGLGALALSVPVTAICYGIGMFVESRATQPVAPTLGAERVRV